MPSSSRSGNGEKLRRRKVEAADDIHQLLLQAIDKADEADLDFLVYMLSMAVEACKEITQDFGPKSR